MSRRPIVRVGRLAGAALLVLATARCGLLGPPGGYSGGDDPADAAAEAAGDGSTRTDSAVLLPDGNVVAASTGTIAVLAGERDPTSADDDPAWSADAWSGILDATGHVVSWRIEPSAPLVGSFDSAGLIGNKWVMVNVGFGIAGGRGTAVQQTSWTPGIAGDWRAANATGAPGGLSDTTRAFVGSRLAYVGGTRSVAVDGGTATIYTNELHLSNVDTTANSISSSTDTGVQLVRGRARAGVAFGASNIYVVGGRGQSGFLGSVETAHFDVTAGTAQAFAEQAPLKTGGADHRVAQPGVVVESGYLWIAGGRINVATAAGTDVVLSAKIDAATGALGDFQTVTKLPAPLRDHALVGWKGRLYVFGGVGADKRSDAVYSATIGTDGTLGAWDSDAKLPGARSDFVALAY